MTSPGPAPVWLAIASKRAIRRFDARPLESEHVERIVAAGRHSGSSKNLQRWTFIVCRDRDHLNQLAAVVRRRVTWPALPSRSPSSPLIPAPRTRPSRSCSTSDKLRRT